MEWTPENKRKIYIVGGIILVLFVVGLMLKFWIYSVVAIGCFAGGFFYGRSTKSDKKDKKKGLF